jgi:Ca-activated chloride channel family protein
VLVDATRRRIYDQQASGSQASGQPPYFSLQVTPSKRTVQSLSEPQVVYLLVEIFPDPTLSSAGEKRESRLNLTLVVDRSNSMNGTRMDKVKVAAHQIIDNLNEDDILSVVTFNDRADVVIPATTVEDPIALKAKVSTISPFGGTEIYKGLNRGMDQVRRYLGPKLVNHIILLTDGHTYGDQEQSMQLADAAAQEGIGISAMGLGHDWNDDFLDSLASRTGGNSEYINSSGAVVRFLNDHVRNLSDAFAERLRLSVAPNPDVVFESAFKLFPHPQPLAVDDGQLLLGSLQYKRPVSVLLQFQLPEQMPVGFRYVARLVATGDILSDETTLQDISDFSIEVGSEFTREEPPAAILDALSKLTLYRLQESAQDALASGNNVEATRRLENLATRLLELGQGDLAKQALAEARRVAHTSDLSDKGRKTLKYQTRHLLLGASGEENT